MFSPYTNKLEEVFESGRLPQLVYVTRQEYGITRPMHSHDSICELMLCYEGNGVYNLGSHSYPIKEGDLIFYNAGKEHELLAQKGVHMGAYCLAFSGLKLKQLPENCLIPAGSHYVVPSGSQFTLLKEMAEKILDLDMNDRLDSVMADMLAVTYILLAKSCHASETSVITKRESELTNKVKDYITVHLAENIRLQNIADSLNYSVSYISHVFRKENGYSPIEYLIRRRIGYAETLLITSDLSVTHIATLCGYDSPNHFQDSFKKIAGISPLQYRKQYLASLHGSRKQE